MKKTLLVAAVVIASGGHGQTASAQAPRYRTGIASIHIVRRTSQRLQLLCDAVGYRAYKPGGHRGDPVWLEAYSYGANNVRPIITTLGYVNHPHLSYYRYGW